MATVIKAKHYDETEARMAKDPVIIAMAHGLANEPREKLAHDDGTPRFEFMQAANKEYAARGGTDGGHIGAAARALLQVLDSGAVKQKVVTYFANRSVPGATGDENAAMAYASIVSKEPSLKEAKKQLAHYMTDEASYLLQNGGDWAVARADLIFDQVKKLATADFSGEKDWEALDFEADGILFKLTRVAKG